MAGEEFLARLNKEFGDKIKSANLEAIDPWIEVSAEAIVEVFDVSPRSARPAVSICSTASRSWDYFEPDPKKAAKVKFEPHLELVYHLSSITNKHTLVVKIELSRWKDDIEGELPEVPTVSDVWRTADWHERENVRSFRNSIHWAPQFAAHPLPRRLGRVSATQRLRDAIGISRHSWALERVLK